MPSFNLDATQLMTEVYSYPFPEVRQLLSGIALDTNGRRAQPAAQRPIDQTKRILRMFHRLPERPLRHLPE
jgi:hypothetical protein